MRRAIERTLALAMVLRGVSSEPLVPACTAAEVEQDRTVLLQVNKEVHHRQHTYAQESTSHDEVHLSQQQQIPAQLIMTGPFATLDELPPEAKANLANTRARNPDLTVRYLDNAGCRSYLQDHFDVEFLQIFDDETHGSFRGDICRSAVLSLEGGFYIDLDFELHVPLRQLIDKDTTLMSVFAAPVAEQSVPEGSSPIVLNALIAVRPNNTVMKNTLQKMKEWYAAPPHNLLGPVTMAQAVSDLVQRSCPEVDLLGDGRPAHFTCGAENLIFHQEHYIGMGTECVKHGPVVCTPKRAASHFSGGSPYAVFTVGLASEEARLVGWPRYAACTTAGCGLNGGVPTL